MSDFNEALNKLTQAVGEAFAPDSEEFRRLKAKAAMQAGEIAKLLAERANLKAAKKKLSEDLDQLRKEKAKLKERTGKGAKLSEDLNRLRKEKAELKERTEKDAKFIQELYARIDKAYELVRGYKKAAEDLNVKLWNEREMGAEAGAEMAKLREKIKELEAGPRVGLGGTVGDYYAREVRAHKETKERLERADRANLRLVETNAKLRDEVEKWGETNRRNAEYSAELRQRLDTSENAIRGALATITGEDALPF